MEAASEEVIEEAAEEEAVALEVDVVEEVASIEVLLSRCSLSLPTLRLSKVLCAATSSALKCLC